MAIIYRYAITLLYHYSARGERSDEKRQEIIEVTNPNTALRCTSELMREMNSTRKIKYIFDEIHVISITEVEND